MKIVSADDVQFLVDEWDKGTPVRDIAMELGVTRGAMDAMILRLRDAGYEIKYRREIKVKIANGIDNFLERNK